jgi:hypothetical protein
MVSPPSAVAFAIRGGGPRAGGRTLFLDCPLLLSEAIVGSGRFRLKAVKNGQKKVFDTRLIIDIYIAESLSLP